MLLIFPYFLLDALFIDGDEKSFFITKYSPGRPTTSTAKSEGESTPGYNPSDEEENNLQSNTFAQRVVITEVLNILLKNQVN